MKACLSILMMAGIVFSAHDDCIPLLPYPPGLEVRYPPGLEPEIYSQSQNQEYFDLMRDICSYHERGRKHCKKISEKWQQLTKMPVGPFSLATAVANEFFVFRALGTFLSYSREHPQYKDIQCLFAKISPRDKKILRDSHRLLESIRLEESEDPIADFNNLIEMSPELGLSPLCIFISSHLYEKPKICNDSRLSLLIHKYAVEALCALTQNPTSSLAGRDIGIMYSGFLLIIDLAMQAGNYSLRENFNEFLKSVPQAIIAASLVNYVFRTKTLSRFSPVCCVMLDNWSGGTDCEKGILHKSVKDLRWSREHDDHSRMCFLERLIHVLDKKSAISPQQL